MAQFPVAGFGRPSLYSDPFNLLRREMNRLFEDIGPEAGGRGGLALSQMTLDVEESDNELRICAEAPGVRPEDVEVRLDGDMLTIRGEKHSRNLQTGENRRVSERAFGRFERMIQLPFTPRPEDVQADFEHGVLTVTLKKAAQQARSHRIEVRAGQGQLSQGQEGQAQALGRSESAAMDRTDANRPGVMGDQTMEQNLGQPGDPSARIKEDEVRQAFSQQPPEGQGQQPH